MGQTSSPHSSYKLIKYDYWKILPFSETGEYSKIPLEWEGDVQFVPVLYEFFYKFYSSFFSIFHFHFHFNFNFHSFKISI